MLALSRTDGVLTYAQDDPYIHMAIARNFVEHGVWGIDAGGFDSATSSPLWTMLLAGCFALVGVDDRLPLLLNLASGVGAVALAGSVAVWHGAGGLRSLGLVGAFVLATPLPLLALIGMEHTLQVLLTLAVLVLASDRSRVHPALFALMPLLTALRYEGLLLAAVLCLWLARRRAWAAAAGLGAATLLPPLLYGLVAVGHGQYLLPVSVLLHSRAVEVDSVPAALSHLVGGTYARLWFYPSVAAVLLAVLLLLARAAARGRAVTALHLWLGLAVLHLTFAEVGIFLRYEAYLVAAAVLFGGVVLLGQARPRGWAEVALLLFVCAPLAERAYHGTTKAAAAATNVYQQHYQMARFFREQYPSETIALNDVGAVAYYGDGRIVDLVGLGTPEVAAARLAHRYGVATINEVTRAGGAPVAALYEEWFTSGHLADALPSGWVKVAEWELSNEIGMGGRTIVFMATEPGEVARLAEAMRRFGPTLPPGVRLRMPSG